MLYLPELQEKLSQLGRPHTPGDVAEAMRQLDIVVSDTSLLETLTLLRQNSTGAGPLEDLLQLPDVSDVIVNGCHSIYVDRGQGLEAVEPLFGSDEEVRHLAVRLAAAVGRRLDDAHPYVDGRLADGTRLHAVLAPTAEPGTLISLRVPAREALTLAELTQRGSLNDAGLRVIQGIINCKLPFLISGGTGSGKTTMLAAMLSAVPESERVVIVEDARELAPQHPHCVKLESRPPNGEGKGALNLTTLVRQALRMRPDRVVLGEVRGAELCDMLTALNTGHEGGCGTVHANSVQDVPARLEALAALGGLDRNACHAQVAAALRVALHIRRWPNGQRTLQEVGIFRRGNDGLVSIVDAVSFAGSETSYGPGWSQLQEWVQL